MVIMILKIIGIILFIILGLIIFLLGQVLFLPIRYQFDGAYDKQLNGEALIKWAPAMLKAKVSVKDGKTVYVVRLLGGVIATNTDKKISWLGRKIFSFEDEEESQKKDDSEAAESTVKKKENVSYEVVPQDDIEFEKPEASLKKRKNQSFYEKIKKKIIAYKRKWKSFVNKLGELKEKKDDLLKVYHSKRYEAAKKDVILYIKELIQITKPSKLEGNIVFGFDDPALTGQLLGKAAMLLPFYDNFLNVRPDFTRQCFEGDLKGRGKIYVFSLLKLIIKVKFNKNLIIVTKKVQTIIEA